ncbi:MAG: hypothetical protein NTW28_04245, partial [Candidatus Solibacter sp.]|nr:hypothetical protein [Candidatus Solibacter sp.]
MNRPHRRVCIYLLAITMFSMTAWADQFVVGLLTWDSVAPGSFGSFNISNQTGVNSSTPGDPTFPVVTSLTFSGLSLNVHFTDGSSSTKGPSYFTSTGSDGSFNGGDIAVGGGNPLPNYAQLTGNVGPLS